MHASHFSVSSFMLFILIVFSLGLVSSGYEDFKEVSLDIPGHINTKAEVIDREMLQAIIQPIRSEKSIDVNFLNYIVDTASSNTTVTSSFDSSFDFHDKLREHIPENDRKLYFNALRLLDVTIAAAEQVEKQSTHEQQFSNFLEVSQGMASSRQVACTSGFSCWFKEFMLNKCTLIRQIGFLLFWIQSTVLFLVNTLGSILCLCIFSKDGGTCALTALPPCRFASSVHKSVLGSNKSSWESIKISSLKCQTYGV